ncbi:hypothetical protein BDDG_11605 [Blastomyces dermatitidis ATCC 18188]|uniref:Protein transport protein SEC31 n=3 Tax=Ajellomyces dermatitidis TaxID=5039 RepID=A0A0J9EKC8_AJEDA|nr:hypothetical protein BDDG_11605 [Blastomyces dermatitidis ATCC 18188]
MAIPPPPRGPAAPPRMTPPPAVGQPHGFQAPERPPSTSSAYTPTTQHLPPGPAMIAPQIPRGPSPYNAPPSGPPPSNRYAPSPAAQPSAPQPPRPAVAPPPTGAPAPAPVPSPHAYHHPPAPAQGPYAPPSAPAAGRPEPPHPGSAPASRPGTAQSQRKPAPAAKYPPGDRTHIPANAQPIFEILSADMQRVKARAPTSFKAQVNDAERRLNILFDHLNNEDLLKPATVESMAELARAIQARDYDTAQAIHLDIFTNRNDECGNWMVGVKRLIGMSRATP